MRKLKVGVDKDNTINRYIERVCEILEQKHNIYLPVGEISHYHFWANHCAISELMASEIMLNLIGKEQIDLLPIREAIITLNSLQDKISTYMITNTMQYLGVEEDLAKWTEINNFICDDIIITSKKHEVVAELDLDFMIDDRGSEALKVASTCPSCKVLLYNRPWNRFVDTKCFPNLQRVNDWYEIDNILSRKYRELNYNV
jgi:uncharacterized HAD superfamily protein